MFEFSKFAGWLISPLSLALGGLVLGLILRHTRYRRMGVVLSFACLVMLWMVASPWGAQALSNSLERRYPAQTVEQTPAVMSVEV